MNTHTTTNDTCIDVCNSLLRGEISAIETYTQAIDKFREANTNEVSFLDDIRLEHVASANRLRENVHEMRGAPANESGAWGAWAKSVEGTAKLFGDTAALKALQQGEEHGEKEYLAALENDQVLPGCKELIRGELLPRQRRTLAAIGRLVEGQ